MAIHPSRRGVLGAILPVAALAVAGGVALTGIRRTEVERYHLVPAHPLAKSQIREELDRAVERIEVSLTYVCVWIDVRRLGDEILFDVQLAEEGYNRELVQRVLRWIEPTQLRIRQVEAHAVNVGFDRWALPQVLHPMIERVDELRD